MSDGGLTEFVIPALLGLGGKIGAAALQPGAPVMPFGHGGTVPEQLLSGTENNLEGMLKMLLDRASKPVSLPDAIVPGDLPTFRGGGLPMEIGLTSHPGSLSTPYVMPGLDVSGFPGYGGSSDVQHNPGGQGGDPTGGVNGGGNAGANPHQVGVPVRRSLLPDDPSAPPAGTGTGGGTGGDGGTQSGGDPTIHALSLLKSIAAGQVK